MDATSPTRHPELVSGSIAITTLLEWLKAQITRKIAPRRVVGFDQVDLPLPAPILDLLLASYGFLHRAKRLIVNQSLNAVPSSEAAGHALAMLDHPGYEIGGNAGVECSSIAACEKVDAGMNVAFHCGLHDGRWMLKQVQHDGGLV